MITSELLIYMNYYEHIDYFQNFLIRALQENENKTVIVLIMQTRCNYLKCIMMLYKESYYFCSLVILRIGIPWRLK